MKLVTFFVIAFVAKVSASSDPLALLDSEEVEENEDRHPHGSPLPLMIISPLNHSISVDYEAIDGMFSNPEIEDRKIVAVSVIGALRKGKSFFMNYCLRFMYANYKSINYIDNPLSNKMGWIGMPEDKLKGFSWQGGAERHTTGVNMWSDIFLHDIERPGKSTEKLAIILMDTQGLFDTKTSPADNSRIFALGTLISSIQIFNLNDVIQENQLEYLQLATSYAQAHTNVSSGDKYKPFQSILFLMRDWVNPLDHPYGYAGGQAYIREILKKRKDQSPSLAQVRDYIENSFDTIECFLMPHPGQTVTEKGYNGSFVLMSPNFKKNLETLIEELLKPSNLVKKRILGQLVVGKSFGEYIKTFFEKFQSPETPQITSIYELVIERQMINYLAEAMQKYRVGVNQFVDFNKTREDLTKSLDKIYREGKKTAIIWFAQTKKMGTKDHEDKFTEQLIKEIDSYNTDWRKTTLETFDTMQRSRAESLAEVAKIKEETDLKLKKEQEEADKEKEAIEIEHNKTLENIKKQTELSQKEKEEQIKKLEEQREKDKIDGENNLKLMMENHAREAEKQREANEAKLKAEIDSLKNANDGKQQMFLEQLEQSRKMFTDMMQQQTEARNEEKQLLMIRWEREDKKSAEEMKLLVKRMDLEASIRREEIKSDMEGRKFEREERQLQWERQNQQWKEDIKDRQADRNHQLEIMQGQMDLMKAKSSCVKPSISSMIVMTVAFVFASFYNEKK